MMTTQWKRDQDSIERFCADLRALRLRENNPTLAALAERAQVSKSILAEAFKGTKLPTENTVHALARALNDNPAAWLQRRARLDPRATAPRAPLPERPQLGMPESVLAPLDDGKAPGALESIVPPEPAPHTRPPQKGSARSRKRGSVTVPAWFGTLTLVLAFSAGAFSIGVLGATTSSHLANAASAEQQSMAVADSGMRVLASVRAEQTDCLSDAEVLEERQDDVTNTTLILFGSTKCAAVWGEVRQIDNEVSSFLSVRLHISNSPSRFIEATEFGQSSARTGLIVRMNREATICVDGARAINGVPVPTTASVCKRMPG